MKPRYSNQRNLALTLTEVLVSVVVACVLAGVALLMFHRPKVVHRIVHQNKSSEIQCVNNLKQVGLAFRIWEGDNGDKFPMQVPAKMGGAMEAAARGNVAPIFQLMSNELSTPRDFICPADADRDVAHGFGSGFDNSHISYFAGVDAADDKPAMFLSGDDNFRHWRCSGQIRPAVAGDKCSRHLDRRAPYQSGQHWLRRRFSLDYGRQTTRSRIDQTGVATNRLAIP